MYIVSLEGTTVYDLSAVLIHRGPSAYSGHYVAHIRNQETDVWYKFNDEKIEKMESDRLTLSKEDEQGTSLVMYRNMSVIAVTYFSDNFVSESKYSHSTSVYLCLPVTIILENVFQNCSEKMMKNLKHQKVLTVHVMRICLCTAREENKIRVCGHFSNCTLGPRLTTYIT